MGWESCEELQARHYARRTVTSYEQWLRRFLRFHRPRHPQQMGSTEVNAFLTHLAVDRKVSASTQNQALSPRLGKKVSPYSGGVGLAMGVSATPSLAQPRHG